MNNARSDTFAVGGAEGQLIEQLSIAEAKKMPSGDSPGKTVASVLAAKRLSSGHRMHVLAIKHGAPVQPVTVKDGVFRDGHHRLAAAEDAGLTHVPARRFPV